MSFSANALKVNSSRRSGFAGFVLVELLAVVALAFLTLSLLTPAVLQSRAAARRDQCADNLKRLALAVHCYHDVNNALPAGQDGSDLDYGFRVALLPYLNETTTYDLATRYRADGVRFAETGADLREKRFAFYACPADAAAQNVVDGCAPANYVANYGDYCPKVEPRNAQTRAADDENSPATSADATSANADADADRPQALQTPTPPARNLARSSLALPRRPRRFPRRDSAENLGVDGDGRRRNLQRRAL